MGRHEASSGQPGQSELLARRESNIATLKEAVDFAKSRGKKLRKRFNAPSIDEDEARKGIFYNIRSKYSDRDKSGLMIWTNVEPGFQSEGIGLQVTTHFERQPQTNEVKDIEVIFYDRKHIRPNSVVSAAHNPSLTVGYCNEEATSAELKWFSWQQRFLNRLTANTQLGELIKETNSDLDEPSLNIIYYIFGTPERSSLTLTRETDDRVTVYNNVDKTSGKINEETGLVEGLAMTPGEFTVGLKDVMNLLPVKK